MPANRTPKSPKKYGEVRIRSGNRHDRLERIDRITVVQRMHLEIGPALAAQGARGGDARRSRRNCLWPVVPATCAVQHFSGGGTRLLRCFVARPLEPPALRVAMGTTWTDLRATRDGIPRRLSPFNA